jgi:hypothetical protein
LFVKAFSDDAMVEQGPAREWKMKWNGLVLSAWEAWRLPGPDENCLKMIFSVSLLKYPIIFQKFA